jgi:hypothetical protein
METCPKIASPRPPVEGRQPPRLATEANKFPIRGGYRSYGAFGSFKIGAAPAVYHPVGLAPGLSSLSSLCSHISAGAAGSEGALGSLFDDCFRPLLGLTPPFPASLHPGWPGPREFINANKLHRKSGGGPLPREGTRLLEIERHLKIDAPIRRGRGKEAACQRV